MCLIALYFIGFFALIRPIYKSTPQFFQWTTVGCYFVTLTKDKGNIIVTSTIFTGYTPDPDIVSS